MPASKKGTEPKKNLKPKPLTYTLPP